MSEIRPAMLCWKSLCVKYLCRYVIDNYSRDFQASNCARVSIKPGRATTSKRQLLKLPKRQRQKREAQLPSSSLTSGAVLPQHKDGQSQSELPHINGFHYTERGALTREGLSNLVQSVLTQFLTLWLKRSVGMTALAATLS